MFVLCISLLAGCAPPMGQPSGVTDGSMPAQFPEAYYRQTKARGAKILRVDASRSLVVISVHRGGTLRRFGHDHVVASHDVNGFVAPDEGRADLYLPLDRLAVDEPDLRKAAGLDAAMPNEAIEGTRRNMLEKVLESARFPFAQIRIARMEKDPSKLTVAISLHGMTRTFQVPVQIETTQNGFAASGQMSFNQTDFGLVPYAVLGGALQVQDRLDLRFRILAEES
ncbi:MAG: YceI family protein [Burkholderiales bacterium]|nr:YceI family protein [Burkholderiales bacterium]